MVVAVEYISKEESADVAAGSASAKHGVTGILAVQGAFAEHAAMLDCLGAPWKLLRAAEDFDDSIDRAESCQVAKAPRRASCCDRPACSNPSQRTSPPESRYSALAPA